MRMLASGVSPNAYTYAVLIRVLVKDAKFLKDAKEYVLEMMDKGMRPNAETYTAVFKGLVREEKLDEAVQLLEQMKAKGFVPDEKAVGEVLADKRGSVFRNVMNILFGN
uniref:PROP1-like PPR domain-containing protein n=1 Tax=Lotus japonicus TaxID=34305 RepID=I3SFK7_LOTJA|nr:unknown [Lotus japonicus]